MVRYRRFRRTSLAAGAVGAAGLLAGCAAMLAGQPTPLSGKGTLGEQQPTATQVGVGANPTPSIPRMNPFVAQVRRPGARSGANAYAWLEDVHSKRTTHWILLENQSTAKALAGIPQREWIRTRLAQLQGRSHPGASGEVIVERTFYLGPDGTRLPMEIAHRRDSARDGNQPALLAVYRGPAKADGPLLRPPVLVWIEMGGVYARAQVRDGVNAAPALPGAGASPDRSSALGDLYAAARSLIDQRYTRRARLGIYGRGFGGLMAGAAVTQRPDFFGAALPTGTWAQYRQVSSGNCFPPTLIVTAAHDGTIRPWRGYELAAVLQAEQVCGQPVLIRIDGDEGPQVEQERAVDALAFAAKWLGAQPPGSPPSG